MKSTTRGIVLVTLGSCLLGAAAFASADDCRDVRQDKRQIARTETRIDRLQNAQRFDVRHDRFVAAARVHEKIELNREALREWLQRDASAHSE